MTTNKNLLPCPFCGCKDISRHEQRQAVHGESFSTYLVYCKGCGATTSSSGYTSDQPIIRMNEAEKKWNTRVPFADFEKSGAMKT